MGSRAASLQGPPLGLATELKSRILSWVNAGQLDRELAEGADPRERPELRFRAKMLRRAKTRHQLAKAIRWVVAESQQGAHRIDVDEAADSVVRSNSGLLLKLAERLEGPPPHSLRGLAKVSDFVYSDTSRLYSGGSVRAQAAAIEDALRALDRPDTDQGAAETTAPVGYGSTRPRRIA